MTDLDAIRAALAEFQSQPTTGRAIALAEAMPIVLAALDAMADAYNGMEDWYTAAIEREARLRAALNAISNNVLTDPRAAARAALATGVGSEGTDTGVGSPETAEAE